MISSKKSIVSFIFVVIIAMPFFAFAKTTNWTATIDTDFANAGNWSNGIPTTGDTIQFLNALTSLPTSNLPNSGAFSLVVRNENIRGGWSSKNVSEFMGTGYSLSSFVLGDETHNGDSATLDIDTNAVTVYGGLDTNVGYLYENAVLTIKNGGRTDPEGSIFTQKMTIEAGGVLSISWDLTTTLNGGLDLAGNIEGSGSLDVDSPILVTADDASVNWIYIDTIFGGLNADGHTVVHTNATGSKLIVDQDGIMDLGTTNNTVAGLEVQTANDDIHLNKNWTMAGMTVGLGTSTLIADTDMIIDGASATTTATAAKIYASGHAVTVKNLGNIPVTCFDCIDGGGNGALVVFVSTDATLSNLAISSGTLTPTFASSTSSYTDSVANDVSSITVTPTVTQANATIKVNGTTVTSASSSDPISLSVGSNAIIIVVTAQDGTTTETYTITVTRAEGSGSGSSTGGSRRSLTTVSNSNSISDTQQTRVIIVLASLLVQNKITEQQFVIILLALLDDSFGNVNSPLFESIH